MNDKGSEGDKHRDGKNLAILSAIASASDRLNASATPYIGMMQTAMPSLSI